MESRAAAAAARRHGAHDTVTSLLRPNVPIRDFGMGGGGDSGQRDGAVPELDDDDAGGDAEHAPGRSKACRAQRGAVLAPASLAADLGGELHGSCPLDEGGGMYSEEEEAHGQRGRHWQYPNSLPVPP